MPAAADLGVLRDGAELEALDPAEWDELVLARPRPSPFLLHDWVVEWWRHHGEGARLEVHVARRDGRLIGVLPLCARRRAGLTVLRFVGENASALADVLTVPGPDSAPLARALLTRARGEADSLDLFGVPGGSPLLEAIDGDAVVLSRVEAPVMDLAAGWEAAYRAKTSAKTRNGHGRRRRHLERLGTVAVEVSRTPEEVVAALPDAYRLHLMRWHGRPDGSGFATPRGQRFHTAVLRRLAERDRVRVVTLCVDDRPIAFISLFLLRGTMVLHRLAYDAAYAQQSPGLLTLLAALETVAGEGVHRVEFLGGAEGFKVALADRLEPLHEIVGPTGTSARGRVAAAARSSGVRIRHRLGRTPAVRRLYYDGLAPLRARLRDRGP